jgi:two-component system sensor histidine kinase MprB
VTLELTRVPAAPRDRFRFTVSDDGPGIAESDLPHLFERFYRSRSVRDQEGTGLGLAIVREIVLRHDGQVHAERLTPRGARFVVELPAAE